MSEERFDRLESQLTQLIQGMTVMQQDITGMKGDITGMKDDITDIKDDLTQLNQRVDSVQGTLNIAVSEGFKRLNTNIIDVSRALGENEEKTDDNASSIETTTRNIRRLNQRLLRLEQRSEEI
jgi:chromosome segregation ATPase